jgi:hypothetical protein
VPIPIPWPLAEPGKECCRRTVAEARKVLEWAGVLTWQHRIARVRERCRDLFGSQGWRWRVIRTSNAYVFRDPTAVAPHPVGDRGFRSECKNSPGTSNQLPNPTFLAPDSPLEAGSPRNRNRSKRGLRREVLNGGSDLSNPFAG